jgi:hypothetical protein
MKNKSLSNYLLLSAALGSNGLDLFESSPKIIPSESKDPTPSEIQEYYIKKAEEKRLRKINKLNKMRSREKQK